MATIINLNDTTPAAPSGRTNVKWQGDSLDPRNVSAYVEPFTGSGASHAPGAVPDPGASAGTARFLCESGAWATPSGVGGGSWTLLQEQVLASPAASITFSSISGSYRHLVIIFQARGSDAATNAAVAMTFNGDTSGSYDRIFIQGQNVTASANNSMAATSIGIASIPAASATANEAASWEILIPFYAGTVFYKKAESRGGTILTEGTASSYNKFAVTGSWRKTSAITQIKLADGSGGNFIAGSVFDLYAIA